MANICIYFCRWWFFYASLAYYYYFVWKRTQIFLVTSSDRVKRLMKFAKFAGGPAILLAPVLLTLRTVLPREILYSSSGAIQTTLKVASFSLVLANLTAVIFTFSSNVYITRCILNSAKALSQFKANQEVRNRIGKRLIVFLCLSAFFTSLGILALFFTLDLTDPDVFYTTPLMFGKCFIHFDFRVTMHSSFINMIGFVVRKCLDNVAISWYMGTEIFFQVTLTKILRNQSVKGKKSSAGPSKGTPARLAVPAVAKKSRATA